MTAPALAPVAPDRPRIVPGAARTHLRLLVNPLASRFRESDREAVTRALRPRFAVSSALTEAAGHATELARAAAEEGYDVVAVLGGDGTVSQAAGGLVGAPTPMACLPAGVTNVFARSIGTPRDPVAAAARLAELAEQGRLDARAVDVGTANGRHFLYTAGVGFTAAMAETADRAPERKATLGQLHFAAAAFSEIGGRYLRNPPRMRVRGADGLDEEGVTVVLQNCHALTYFGPRQIRLSDAAGLQTGGLSLTLLRRSRPLDVASVIARLLSGRTNAVARHPHVAARPMLAAVTVDSVGGEPLPLDADGEFLGSFRRVAFGVEPAALRVVG
jgi:diacylglycerol kinase family enzyme